MKLDYALNRYMRYFLLFIPANEVWNGLRTGYGGWMLLWLFLTLLFVGALVADQETKDRLNKA